MAVQNLQNSHLIWKSLLMTKTVVTVDGDSIDGLLHKHLGAYSDATEEKFYQLNPSATSLPAVLSS